MKCGVKETKKKHKKKRERSEADRQTDKQTNTKQKTENRKQKTLGFSKFIYKTMLRVELSEAFY